MRETRTRSKRNETTTEQAPSNHSTGGSTVHMKIYRKSVSTNRHTVEITEKTKRVDIDR